MSVFLQSVFPKLLFLSSVVPGMEGVTLSDASLTNSYFSSSFIGVNGFGSPAESKYSMMQVRRDADIYLEWTCSIYDCFNFFIYFFDIDDVSVKYPCRCDVTVTSITHTFILYAALFSEWLPAVVLPVFSMMVPRTSATALMVNCFVDLYSMPIQWVSIASLLRPLHILLFHRSPELPNILTVQWFWCS